jgi:hypothetical protein
MRFACALLGLAGLGLVGCGGGSSEPAASPSSPSATTTAGPAAAGSTPVGTGAVGNPPPAAEPRAGIICEREQATVGELVCTKMQDGKLVWAGRDGQVQSGGPGASPGSGPGGGAKLGAGCETAGTKQAGLECRTMSDGMLIWANLDGSIGAPTGAMSLAQGLAGPKGCDPNGPTRYSAPMVDPATVSYIYPLGAMTTTHITPVDHIYVYYPEGTRPAGTYRITAPADGTVVDIQDFQKSNNYPYPDHRIVVAHSCRLFSVFIHVGPLSPALAAAFTDGTLRAPVAVKAGDLLADDSANPGFDFSTFDEEVRLKLANPASYYGAEQWKPFTAGPFSYFPAEVRAAYERLSLRTEAPFDGRIDWDVPGTAQGIWFVQGTNGYRGVGSQSASYDNQGKTARGYWDTHLAIAPDAVDNSAIVFSVGDWDGCPCQFMAKGNGIDPKTLTAGAAPTVFELVEFRYVNADGSRMNESKPTKGYRLVPGDKVAGLLVLQVEPDGSMRVEKLPGAASSSAFGGYGPKALTYVR